MEDKGRSRAPGGSTRIVISWIGQGPEVKENSHLDGFRKG